MPYRLRRFPVYLLVALLVTWGTCPCVFAKMLGLGTAELKERAEHSAPPAPC